MQLQLYKAPICVLSVATAATRYQLAAAKIDLGGPSPRRLLRRAPFQSSALLACASPCSLPATVLMCVCLRADSACDCSLCGPGRPPVRHAGLICYQTAPATFASNNGCLTLISVCVCLPVSVCVCECVKVVVEDNWA